MSGYNSYKDIQKMIERYVAGTATAEEAAFVESYYAYQDRNEVPDISADEKEALRKETFENISNQLNATPQTKKRIINIYRYATVAAVLLVATTTAYLFLHRASPSNKLENVSVKKPLDVMPGSNKAILTLADGSTMILDDKADGNLKELPGLIITKTRKGELVYKVLSKQSSEQITAINTVTTPKGGQYQVVLPDGTRVWLNAASRLTYPQFFAGKTREVKLEGEGYFEVSKNKAMPFHVFTGNQDVEVTGTHFNINGYMDDGSINTTLLEGGITLHHHGRSQKIIPGEQANVLTKPFAIKVQRVDTEEVVAWKNGLFEFNNASLRQIMSQLERWYDIKVDYSSLPAKRYNGMVPRSANLSRVLKMLEVTGNIKFEIQNNRQLSVMAE
ncbi:FecR domain-containing protein [Mucilaginibacter sp. PAMB04168]|uniref:FecR family protein n=1 Tax=Mucilaginibacter sp. PAMB04168 TaxID=3138567 RepID=UPI0031F5F59D